MGPVDPKAKGPEIFRGTTTLGQVSVLPQPVQSPHTPIWEPFATERSIRYAAAHGLNGNFSILDTKSLKEKIGVYMSAAEQAGWPDYQDRGEFKWGWDGRRRREASAVRWIHVEEPDAGSVKRPTRSSGATRISSTRSGWLRVWLRMGAVSRRSV